MKITPALSIGIIGGEGRTGGQFARLFRERGFSVKVSGKKTKNMNTKIIQECDIVIFSLPLVLSVKEMKTLCRSMKRTDQLVLDLSSLKEEQVNAMLSAKGEVIGMHPLFGPSTDPAHETIILCPARAGPETVRSLAILLQKMGLKTVEKSARDHDAMMALVQALPHFKSLLMASVLRAIGADLDDITATCTPTYEIEFNVIGRFLDDSPDLYMPIIFENPQTVKILKKMRFLLDRYIDIAERKNLPEATRDYRSLARYFGVHASLARKRSEECIRLLASLS